MKKLILSICFMCLFIFGFAQVPDWLWAKSAGGQSYDIAYSVALDDSGNAYITGAYFSDSIAFGTTILPNVGGSYMDVFLAKYDVHGNLLWAKSAGGTSNEYRASVAVDAIGNAYVSGSFISPVLYFDTIALAFVPGCGPDIFLAKYDAGGNVKWAHSYGTSKSDEAFSVAQDDKGNVYITGYFGGTSITFDTVTLWNQGGLDVFIAKIDSGGHVIWAKRAGASGAEIANSVAIDTSGNAYITGYFYDSTVIFGSSVLHNSDSTGATADVFIIKYDTSGSVLWAGKAGGNRDDYSTSVATDSEGDAYVAGYFGSSALTLGMLTLTNTSVSDTDDIFLAKYDAYGNEVWVKGAEGSLIDRAQTVAVDGQGNVYMTGNYQSPAFTMGATTLMNSIGVNAGFLVKYAANGTFIWATSLDGGNSVDAYSVAIDTSGYPFLAGSFSSATLNVGSTILTNVHNTGYTSDVFLAKLDTVITTVNYEFSANENSLLIIYPNPANNNLTIETSETSAIEILNLEGQIVKTVKSNGDVTTIDVSSLSGGVYIIRAKTDHEIATKKFIKQ
jgi:hypothetical protein